MKKIAHIFLVLTHIFLLVSLVLAYLSVFISPEEYWIPAFFGLAYPVILLLNLLMAIYWAIRKRKKLLIISALFILLGVTYITDYYQIRFFVTQEEQESDLKIMSYNVKLFDLYNWKNNVNTRNDIFTIVDSVDADIICFQEFYKEKINRFNTLDTLLKFQEAINYHEEYSQVNSQKYFFGIATLSKYPIINKGIFKFEDSDNICIYSDIVRKNDTIRVYNAHLASIRFDYSDYNFIDSIELKLDEKRLQGIKTISRRLKRAFILRAKQVDVLSEHVNNSPYPVIICGDFNDTPVSYAYRQMTKNRKDAFKEAGCGIGRTYSGRFPSFRIDYILHSKNISTRSFNIVRKEYSDHYPIIANLYFD